MPTNRFCLLIFVFTLMIVPTRGQSNEAAPWTITEDCLTVEEAFLETYPGRIFAYEPGTGIRGISADVPSSYFVAFAGTNFTGASAISPNGAWIAIPAGYINLAGLEDYIYVVNEIRVQSTDFGTVNITRRIPWQAQFRGTEVDEAVRDIRWLDNAAFRYTEETWENDDPAFYTVNAFLDAAEGDDDLFVLDVREGVSPDGTLVFGIEAFEAGVFDRATGDLIAALSAPRHRLVGWLPDSGGFITMSYERRENENVPQVTWFDRNGERVSLITELPVNQFTWSPRGDRFAFSVYDAARGQNTLYIGDPTTQTLRDTCLDIRWGNRDLGYGLKWSPTGDALAVMRSTINALYIVDLDAATVAPVPNYTEADPSYLLGWYLLGNEETP